MEHRIVDGHRIEVGDDMDGAGRRIQIDGTDITDEVLSIIGPPKTDRLDGKGLPVPRGDDYILGLIENLVLSGTIDVEASG